MVKNNAIINSVFISSDRWSRDLLFNALFVIVQVDLINLQGGQIDVQAWPWLHSLHRRRRCLLLLLLFPLGFFLDHIKRLILVAFAVIIGDSHDLNEFTSPLFLAVCRLLLPLQEVLVATPSLSLQSKLDVVDRVLDQEEDVNDQIAEENAHDQEVCLVFELLLVAIGDHGEGVDKDDRDDFIKEFKPLEQGILEGSTVDEIGELDEGEAQHGQELHKEHITGDFGDKDECKAPDYKYQRIEQT